MNDKLESAIKAIETSRLVFRKAEEEAIKTMKFVLEKAGENGVDICPGDFTDDLYVAVAEIEASIFEPVASIRYWKSKLEVFIPNHKRDGEQGWEILPEGRWVDYEDAKLDTWLMLDLISENIEYSDGYQD